MEIPFEPVKYTEQNICDIINGHYNGNARYKVANVYVFKSDWESDFFVQKENGYCYEFEVKISRSDFLNDKKKLVKHSILKTGSYTIVSRSGTWNGDTKQFDYIEKSTVQEHAKRPNKFYYVVPQGMIAVNEVPDYAGLIYTNGFILTEVKTAPFIHKEKIDFTGVLCKKFYHYWLEEKFRARGLEREIAYLKSKLPEYK